MATNSFNLDFLSPTGSVGLIILITGILFTALMASVFYRVNNDSDSLSDRQRKEAAKTSQQERIARLYPSRKN